MTSLQGRSKWGVMQAAAAALMLGCAGALQGRKLAKKEGRAGNNHGNRYIAQVAGIAWYLGDKAAIRDLAGLMESKLNAQLKPDGTQPAELARTRSFHYSYFNLRAICMMAVLAQKNGIDLWRYKTPQGGGVLTSLDFMAHFTNDRTPWPYQTLDQIRVRPVPLLSWADNATGEKRYERQIRRAAFTLPPAMPAIKETVGGHHDDAARGAVLEAGRETWLLTLPSFAIGYIAPLSAPQPAAREN